MESDFGSRLEAGAAALMFIRVDCCCSVRDHCFGHGGPVTVNMSHMVGFVLSTITVFHLYAC